MHLAPALQKKLYCNSKKKIFVMPSIGQFKDYFTNLTSMWQPVKFCDLLKTLIYIRHMFATFAFLIMLLLFNFFC